MITLRIGSNVKPDIVSCPNCGHEHAFNLIGCPNCHGKGYDDLVGSRIMQHGGTCDCDDCENTRDDERQGQREAAREAFDR